MYRVVISFVIAAAAINSAALKLLVFGLRVSSLITPCTFRTCMSGTQELLY